MFVNIKQPNAFNLFFLYTLIFFFLYKLLYDIWVDYNNNNYYLNIKHSKCSGLFSIFCWLKMIANKSVMLLLNACNIILCSYLFCYWYHQTHYTLVHCSAFLNKITRAMTGWKFIYVVVGFFLVCREFRNPGQCDKNMTMSL